MVSIATQNKLIDNAKESMVAVQKEIDWHETQLKKEKAKLMEIEEAELKTQSENRGMGVHGASRASRKRSRSKSRESDGDDRGDGSGDEAGRTETKAANASESTA